MVAGEGGKNLEIRDGDRNSLLDGLPLSRRGRSARGWRRRCGRTSGWSPRGRRMAVSVPAMMLRASSRTFMNCWMSLPCSPAYSGKAALAVHLGPAARGREIRVAVAGGDDARQDLARELQRVATARRPSGRSAWRIRAPRRRRASSGCKSGGRRSGRNASSARIRNRSSGTAGLRMASGLASCGSPSILVASISLTSKLSPS